MVSDMTDTGNVGDPCNLFEFFSWFKDNNGPHDGGFDGLVGSWLLDENALTTDLNVLKEGIKTFTPPGSPSAPYLVLGKESGMPCYVAEATSSIRPGEKL